MKIPLSMLQRMVSALSHAEDELRKCSPKTIEQAKSQGHVIGEIKVAIKYYTDALAEQYTGIITTGDNHEERN
jgi:hypothetical protein